MRTFASVQLCGDLMTLNLSIAKVEAWHIGGRVFLEVVICLNNSSDQCLRVEPLHLSEDVFV